MPDPAAPRLCRVAGRDTWHIYHQRRRISTGCTDRAAAERALTAYLRGAQGDAASVATITTILAAYLADRADASIAGLDRLRWAHKPLTRFWGDRPAEAVTDTECRRYARERGKTVAQGTARTELQALSAALKWAADKRRRLIPDAPHVALPGRPPARDRWLTREEAAALIAGCGSPHIRLFVLLALHTGARKAAILALPWDRVDLVRRQIDYREPGAVASRKRRAAVPINDTLLPELVRAKKGATTEWVIEWAGGRVASVKRGFREACVRAGLADVTPHTLRHTAATWMAQEGVPMWEIAGVLGHGSTRMVEEVYGHHSPDHLRRATSAIG